MEKKKRRLMDMRLLISTRALSAGRLQLRGLRLACFVLPCLLLLVVLQPNLPIMGGALSVLSLQSTQTGLHIRAVEAEISGSSHRPVAETKILIKEEEKQTSFPSVAESANEISSRAEENKSIGSSGSANVISSPPMEENRSMEAAVGTKNLPKEEDKESQTSNLSPEAINEILSRPVEEKTTMEYSSESVINAIISPPVEESKSLAAGINLDAVESNNVHCDFSQERSDTCSVHGDVRVDGRSSSITVAISQSNTPPEGNSLTSKIRPYSRKWEPQLMDRIREFSIKTLISSSNPDADPPPRCTANHTAPAILFSTGGYVGNFFHDFTDVLIPLFTTSRHYQGEVHFLVSDFNPAWISKYSPILGRLSRHRIINADDDDDSVHCFPQVHVGLLSHRELGVDPSKAPNGYSVGDFRELLRSSYSLRRKSVGGGIAAGRRPRLLIMLRKGSRAFDNARQVVSMGKRSGFKVVAAGPEDARDVARFARVVNSCDVMMGVHGAGLTNMVFLPEGASVVQILPWGGLHYACWHDFGAPAPDMGLNYFEYDIKEKESSLMRRYSRDDPVFKDPLSIHKEGFGAIWSVFLRDQTVKLDVTRFKTVLKQALHAVH